MTEEHISHTGPAVAKRGRGGRTIITCPLGHFLDVVGEGEWAFSAWSTRIGSGYEVTCHGALPRSKP